jgi:hypothetical protein
MVADGLLSEEEADKSLRVSRCPARGRRIDGRGERNRLGLQWPQDPFFAISIKINPDLQRDPIANGFLRQSAGE